MSEYKNRKYTVLLADAASGLELTPALLGFNPSHDLSKVQIATNDFGGTFSIKLSPPGNPYFYDVSLLAAPVGGEDIVVIDPAGTDPLFDALKIQFVGATADIEIYLTFIQI